MHIPDGFLDAKTCVGTSALAVAGLGFALSHAKTHLPPRKVPLLGLSAAFIFAAQMINFPVAAGTSGHLLGGVLAAALLGPSAAVIVLSTVLIVQCFAFADGGITTLGANIFNVGIVGGTGGWMVYALLSRGATGLYWRLVAAIVAAWASTLLASVVCAGELALSGTASWSLVFPAMAWVHMLIGIAEGVITALILYTVGSARPDLVVPVAGSGERSLRPVLVYGALAALGIGIFISPFASSLPDGLETVAQSLGFAERESAVLPEYQAMPSNVSPGMATAIAGGIGTLCVFGLGMFLANALLKPRVKRGGE